MPPENDKPEGQTEAPKTITNDDLTNALSSREKRLEAKFEKMLDAKLSAILEKVSPVKSDAPETPAPANGDPIAAKLKDMEGRLEAEKRARVEQEKLREQEKAERMRAEERSALTEALRGAGVTDAYLRAATAVLNEEKRVMRDETGAIKFKIERDGYADLEDIGKAVKEWVASDEGKIYLPPRDVGGSGSPGNPRGPRPAKGSKEESKADAMQALANYLRKPF